jgi:ubiquinone/menaquinone biosynthesis C-methylase UbiE
MSTVNDVTRFGRIDQEPDPDYFVRFVDEVNAIRQVQEVEALAISELRLTAGGRVLDLGCGTGEDTRGLAALVGPIGSAIGLDASEAMVETARRRSADTGLSVTFQVGDATALDFDDATFDGVRAERLLIHIPEPATVLDEMVRVTRRGGRIVVIDLDFDLFALDLPDVDLTRRTVQAMSDTMAAGRIGRQLPRLFREAGLTDVSCNALFVPFSFGFVAHLLEGSLSGAVSAGTLRESEAETFRQSLATAEKEGGLLAGVPFFVVGGTR